MMRLCVILGLLVKFDDEELVGRRTSEVISAAVVGAFGVIFDGLVEILGAGWSRKFGAMILRLRLEMILQSLKLELGCGQLLV